MSQLSESWSSFICEQLRHLWCHLHVRYPVGDTYKDFSNRIRLCSKDVKTRMTVFELWQRSITFFNFIVGLLNTNLLSLPVWATATASLYICRQIHYPVSNEPKPEEPLVTMSEISFKSCVPKYFCHVDSNSIILSFIQRCAEFTSLELTAVCLCIKIYVYIFYCDSSQIRSSLY